MAVHAAVDDAVALVVLLGDLPFAGHLVGAFDLPADPRLGTGLSATPPRYWELSVKGEAPGVDFASTFLVPVYAIPGG